MLEERAAAQSKSLDDLSLPPSSLEFISPAQLDLVLGQHLHMEAHSNREIGELGFAWFAQATPSWWYAIPLNYQRTYQSDPQVYDELQINPMSCYKIMDKLVLGIGYEASFRSSIQTPGETSSVQISVQNGIKNELQGSGSVLTGLRLKSERFDVGLVEHIPAHSSQSQRTPRSTAAHGRILIHSDLAVGALFEQLDHALDHSDLNRQAAFSEWRIDKHWLLEALAGEKEAALSCLYTFTATTKTEDTTKHQSVGFGLERQRHWSQAGIHLRYDYSL